MKGIVYRIYTPQPEKEDHCYIGSTYLTLEERINKHKTLYNEWLIGSTDCYVSSFKMFTMYGFDNCNIEIIHEDDFDSEIDLRKKEMEFIMNIECVNIRLSLDDLDLYYKKVNKLYNSVIIKTKKNNIRNVKYEEDEVFREAVKKTTAMRFKNNPHLSQSHICECGGKYSLRNLGNHIKTNKHQNYLLIKENVKTAI